MKISSFYKSRGDEVSFNIDNPDIIYASVIFSKNKHSVDGLKFYYPKSEIILGGSGYSLNSVLPDEIEHCKPDYELYPDIDYSPGFSTRGCDRDCPFCIVRRKEGGFKIWDHPSIWYDEKFSKMVFYDNNILLSQKRFFEVIDFCKEHSLSVDFNQGLDIRLLNEAIIEKMLEVKWHDGYRFAFDNSNLSQIVKNKVQSLQSYGIDLHGNGLMYVYVDSDDMYDDAVWRCRFLKELDVTPFIQFNINKKPTKRIKLLRHWVNRKMGFWSCDITRYTWRKK